MTEPKKKIKSVKEYRKWLIKKLEEYEIDGARLIATVIVVERAIQDELERSGSQRIRPYYKLWKENGKPTRAWYAASELAIWLKYYSLKADPFVRAIIHLPDVRKFLARKDCRNQIPFDVIFPSARKSTQRLKRYSNHFKHWSLKH